MPKITKLEVEKLAVLARLKLSDAEMDKMSRDLAGILEYMDILNEVDTSKISENARVILGGSSGRLDESQTVMKNPEKSDPKNLRSCAPVKIEAGLYKVPSSHK